MQKKQATNALPNFDLENWGLQQVAYLREATVDGIPGFAIYSATGNMIGFSADGEKALGAIVQNDMEPFSLH